MGLRIQQDDVVTVQQPRIALEHDPDAESKFIAAGHGVSRQEIAWNDFIIVGPGADPAHIAGSRDVLAALGTARGRGRRMPCQH